MGALNIEQHKQAAPRPSEKHSEAIQPLCFPASPGGTALATLTDPPGKKEVLGAISFTFYSSGTART